MGVGAHRDEAFAAGALLRGAQAVEGGDAAHLSDLELAHAL